MSANQKFLFDTSFEGPLPAVGEAAPPPPPPEPEESEPAITEDDLARAREEGRQEGIVIGQEQGRDEAFAGIEQTTQNLLVGLTGHIVELLSAQPKMREEVARETLEAAMAVLKKLLPSLEKSAALAEIEAVVAECLERAKEEPRLAIRVSEQMLTPVKGRVDSLVAQEGFEGKIVFLAADGFAESDVRVEWADGGAERRLEDIWQDIDQVLARFLKLPADRLHRATAADARPAAEVPAAETPATEAPAQAEQAPQAETADTDGQETPDLVSPLEQMGLSPNPDTDADDNSAAIQTQDVPLQPDADAAGQQAPAQELKHD